MTETKNFHDRPSPRLHRASWRFPATGEATSRQQNLCLLKNLQTKSVMGNPDLHRALLIIDTRSGPGTYMRSLIVALSASLTFAVVALSTDPSQAGFCQYQYKHCLVRCGVIIRKCVPGCERQLHHCKTPRPNLGELTGTR
jgi:hypothetical protein